MSRRESGREGAPAGRGDALGAAQRAAARRGPGPPDRRRFRRRRGPRRPGEPFADRPVERGEVGVTSELVRRYETVLDLPEGQLGCLMDTFARGHHPVRSTAAVPLRSEPDVDETLELLERALSTERMTGLQWDRLSDSLGRMPHVLVRAPDWEGLISRCRTSSTSVSSRLRPAGEAVARLAGHPRSGPVVARMAEEVMDDPAAQFWSDTVSLLQFTDHPDALRVLMAQLRSPTGDDALRRACSRSPRSSRPVSCPPAPSPRPPPSPSGCSATRACPTASTAARPTCCAPPGCLSPGGSPSRCRARTAPSPPRSCSRAGRSRPPSTGARTSGSVPGSSADPAGAASTSRCSTTSSAPRSPPPTRRTAPSP